MLKVHPPKMNWQNYGRSRRHICLLYSSFVLFLLFIPLFSLAQIELQTLTEPPSCYGGDDGHILTIVQGGSSPYQYQWSNGQTTADLAGLSAGSYSLTLTDALGEVAETQVQLSAPTPMLVFITPTPPSCQQTNNGEILVEVWQGEPPYDFVWADGADEARRSGLATGIYEVTITDAKSCEKVVVVDLEPASVLNAGALGEPASCDLMNDGLLTASAQYGQQPYSYHWSTGDQTQVVEQVSPGYYTVTITDALGCSDTATAVVQTDFNVQVSGSALLCGPGPTSQLSIVAQGGTAPYAYHWNTGDISSEMSGLTEGEYIVTITDASNCKTVEKVEILASDFSISIIPRDVLCHGDSTGSILVQPSGGEPPYQIQWSTGEETDLISDLVAGTYSVTVMDSNGCQLSETLELEEPEPLLVDFEQIDVSCAGASDGTIKINPVGGKPPYSFLWSNNQILGELNNLAAGDYTVTISDANLCEEELHISLTEPRPLEMDVDLFLLTCDGALGGMTAHVDGGVRPYHYLWSNGDTTITSSGLEPGTYGVTVTDANSCSIILDDLILDGEPAFELDIEIQDIECSEEDIGSIQVWVEGGLAPYSYLWSTGETDSSIHNLAVGDYHLTVTDADGCTMMATATVGMSSPVFLSISTQDIACAGQQNGIAKAEASGGLSPYFYNWSTGATGSSIVNLEVGEYSLTVTDSGGCTVQDTIHIQSPDTLHALSHKGDISCFGAQDGWASVSVSGGVLPYEYAWGNGSTDSLIENLPVGVYGVIVRDANDCIVATSITINEPPALTLSLIIEEQPCEGNATGEIRSVVDGGLAPYHFQWSNGDTTGNLNHVADGLYTLTVTDAAGCDIQANVSLNATPGLNVSLDQLNVQCFGQNNGALDAIIEGGLAPFSYVWSTGNTNNRIGNLSSGVYTLTVTDDNGCYDTISTSITEPPLLEIVATGEDISCAGAGDGSAMVVANGGVFPYEYSWGTGENSAQIENLPAGIYGVIVEDSNACIQVASVEILEPPALELSLIVQHEPCEGDQDGQINTQISGGLAPFHFNWSNGDTTMNLSGLSGGLYGLTVTDAAACQIVGEVELGEKPGISLDLRKKDISCFGEANGAATVEIEGGTSPFSFNWSTGAVSESIVDLIAGSYALTVTDVTGCADTLNFDISSPLPLVASVSKEDLSCFGAQDGTISVGVMGGTGSYEFRWSNDSTGADLTGLTAGELEVLILDENSCMLQEKVNLLEPDSLELQFNFEITPCGEEEDGQISAEIKGGTPEYQFNWSTGANNASVNNIGEGQYFLTVTDQNACTLVDSILLTAHPQPSCTIEVIQEVTIGGDGALQANVVGGTSPFQFLWSNGDTTALIDSLSFGDYSVTIMDANECTTSCVDTLMGLATLGSFVWLDENRDGLQDSDEGGFADVAIHLTGVDTSNHTFTASTVTDDSGAYLFEVPPGRYVLEFELPAGFLLTKPNEGLDDEKDSDIDPITFRSDTLSISPRAELLNIDAGCISECDAFTDPGLISASTNYLCGSGNDPGPLLNIVSPTGGSGTTEYVWMQSSFNGPIGGEYWQPIPESNSPSYDPGPLYETTFFVRCARREKCPTFVESNVIQIEVGTEAVAEVLLPTRICEGEEVAFRALGAEDATQIQWSFSGSAIPAYAEGEEASIKFSSFGSFEGSLQVSENDCIAQRSFSFNVINNPILCNSPLQLQTEIVEEANRSILLSWDKPETQDTLRFELQFSPDGVQFRSMRQVVDQLALDSRGLRYVLEEHAPKPGRNFFRLKLLDQEGRFMYSEVRQLLFAEGSALAMLFPNPVEDELHLEFFETFGEPVRVELYNSQGNRLAKKELVSGDAFIHFQLQAFNPGFYFARIYYGDVPIKHLRFFKN